MDLLPTSEQQQIIDSAAAYVNDKMPLQRLKTLARKPEIPSVGMWKEIADLGWLGLGLDPSVGGVGYSASEEVLLFREIGRVAGAPRLIFTVMAAHVAASAGNEALVERLTTGATSAALAVRDAPSGDGESTAGHRIYEFADAQLALAIDGDEARLLGIDGLDIPLRPCMDTSLSMGVADLSNAPSFAA